jgi:hypothetical protein
LSTSTIADPRRRLIVLMWLVALHSFLVGIGLIVLKPTAMPFFGLQPFVEKFFPVQGGVFHLIMCLIYLLGAVNPERFDNLIILAIIAKFMAAAFLILYYILGSQVWMVVLSAVADGLMGLVILLAYRSFIRPAHPS